MERAARGGGAQERWGRARDRVGGAPASAPGSVHPVTARSRSLTAPAALAAASGSHCDGHRLPFPSGGGGGRSLSSRAPSRGHTAPPPRPCATQPTWVLQCPGTRVRAGHVTPLT